MADMRNVRVAAVLPADTHAELRVAVEGKEEKRRKPRARRGRAGKEVPLQREWNALRLIDYAPSARPSTGFAGRIQGAVPREVTAWTIRRYQQDLPERSFELRNVCQRPLLALSPVAKEKDNSQDQVPAQNELK